jgi:protein TonB
MEVILSIVAVIAGVSIYDFYSARKWQLVTSEIRNDVVFQNRNQKYGAYVIRRDYDRNMVYIMLGVICSIGLLVGGFMYFKSEPILEKTQIIPSEVLIPYVIPSVKPDPPLKPTDKVTPDLKSDNIAPPEVVDELIKDKPLTEDELAKLKMGKKNDGKDSVGLFREPIKVIIPPVIIVKPKVDEASEIPDVDPSFPNMAPFIQKKLNYPEEAIQLQKEGKCYLKFVVNLDGSVSEVSILRGVPDCPECDKEAMRVVRLMKNWEPGTINGKPVRSWMRLPINFKLE